MIVPWHTFYARLIWQSTAKSAHCRKDGCELFELRQYSDVTPFERHMEEVQIGLRPIGSTIRCPKCRQRNFKVKQHSADCTGVVIVDHQCYEHWFVSVYMHNLTNDHMHSGQRGIHFLLGVPDPLLLIVQDEGWRQIHEVRALQVVGVCGAWKLLALDLAQFFII